MYRFSVLPAFLFLGLITSNKPQQVVTGETIMAVFAHPDDESFISPLLSKYAREGNIVYLVIATNGQKGTRQHAGVPAGDSLGNFRKKEAECACNAIGIQRPIFLNMQDGALAADFTGEPLRRKLDSVFKQYQPDIIITWGPDGGYGHMDHRMVHNIVTELHQSGLLTYSKALFYTGIPSSNWKQKVQPKTGLGNFFHSTWKPVKDEWLNVRIKYSENDRSKALQALECHWSQFTREEMDDVKEWRVQMNRNDTIYLRSFERKEKITYDFF